MMTRTQLLLLKLAEEAAEVSQIALKAVQFGLDDVWEKVAPLSVRDRLCGELNDVMGVVALLNLEAGLAFEADPAAMEAKGEKVNRYAALSVSLGMVEPGPPSPRPYYACPTEGCLFAVPADQFKGTPDRLCPDCLISWHSMFYRTFRPSPPGASPLSERIHHG